MATIIPSKYERKRPQFGELKGPLETYFFNASAALGSTSSGTPVDYPGPIDKLFIKRDTATALFVSGSIGAFKSTNTGNVFFQLRINSVDYPIAQFFFNDLNTHRAVPFTIVIAPGLVAGTYTARLRWSVANVSAQTDNNDIVQLRIEEGYFA